jgi:hypothetical protein
VFTIVFEKPFVEVPDGIRASILSRLTLIAKTLDTMPRTGPMWKTASVGGLSIEEAPWRFTYRVDIRNETIVVEEAEARGTSVH